MPARPGPRRTAVPPGAAGASTGATRPALGGAPGRPWSCLSEACRSASSWLWWAAPGRSSPSCTWGRWRSGSSCGAAAGATCCAPRGLAVPGCSSPSARACALSAPWHTTRSTGWSRFTTPPVIAMLAETLVTAEPQVSIPPLDPTARPGFGSLSDSRLPGVWRTHSGPHGLYPRHPTSRAGVRPRRTTCLSAPELRGRVSCLACAR